MAYKEVHTVERIMNKITAAAAAVIMALMMVPVMPAYSAQPGRFL